VDTYYLNFKLLLDQEKSVQPNGSVFCDLVHKDLVQNYQELSFKYLNNKNTSSNDCHHLSNVSYSLVHLNILFLKYWKSADGKSILRFIIEPKHGEQMDSHYSFCSPFASPQTREILHS
jgi:hypothetical protein